MFSCGFFLSFPDGAVHTGRQPARHWLLHPEQHRADLRLQRPEHRSCSSFVLPGQSVNRSVSQSVKPCWPCSTAAAYKQKQGWDSTKHTTQWHLRPGKWPLAKSSFPRNAAQSSSGTLIQMDLVCMHVCTHLKCSVKVAHILSWTLLAFCFSHHFSFPFLSLAAAGESHTECCVTADSDLYGRHHREPKRERPSVPVPHWLKQLRRHHPWHNSTRRDHPNCLCHWRWWGRYSGRL